MNLNHSLSFKQSWSLTTKIIGEKEEKKKHLKK